MACWTTALVVRSLSTWIPWKWDSSAGTFVLITLILSLGGSRDDEMMRWDDDDDLSSKTYWNGRNVQRSPTLLELNAIFTSWSSYSTQASKNRLFKNEREKEAESWCHQVRRAKSQLPGAGHTILVTHPSHFPNHKLMWYVDNIPILIFFDTIIIFPLSSIINLHMVYVYDRTQKA